MINNLGRVLVVLFSIFITISAPSVRADWPMAGHDNQRTSAATEDIIPQVKTYIWQKPFTDYIPSKAHIITSSQTNLIYVPTSGGLYALNPDTGAQIWKYSTQLPVGNSPTYSNGILYIPVHDKSVHAIKADTGQLVWRTDSAGAGFEGTILVANNTVYAGNRDGYFYAFDAVTGKYKWSYKTEGAITGGAAYHSSGKIYFGSRDSRVYCLNATTGQLIWKSPQYPGDGFDTFWPVINKNYIIIGRTNNYPAYGSAKQNIELQSHAGILFDEATNQQVELPVQTFQTWINQNPSHKTVYILDATTGSDIATAPFLWWGNSSGNRYPPLIDSTGKIWSATPWWQSNFGRGRLAGWNVGGATMTTMHYNVESGDEPQAYALIGNTVYYNDGGDGVDKGGSYELVPTGGKTSFWIWKSIYDALGEYFVNWPLFKYGNGIHMILTDQWGSDLGTHGHQNPPVPLNGKVFFHRSNAVIGMKP